MDDIEILTNMKLPSGLFVAAQSDEYQHVWLRDNFYISLAYEAVGDTDTVEGIWHGIFDILLAHEWKIDYIVDHGIDHSFEWIHPRYNVDGTESHDPWANRQFDAIGCILTKLPQYIRNDDDARMVQKIVTCLDKVRYYDRADHGMWEEVKVIHASSVGACVAGLRVARMEGFDIPAGLIEKGEARLNDLLPREMYQFYRGRTDLALLSLIWPYNIVSDDVRDQIIDHIETDLLGEYGVSRYTGDEYFMEDGDEAQWSFGLPWLSLITGDEMYLEIAESLRNEKGEIAESYTTDGDGNIHNPLGWTHAMMVCAERFKYYE